MSVRTCELVCMSVCSWLYPRDISLIRAHSTAHCVVISSSPAEAKDRELYAFVITAMSRTQLRARDPFDELEPSIVMPHNT